EAGMQGLEVLSLSQAPGLKFRTGGKIETLQELAAKESRRFGELTPRCRIGAGTQSLSHIQDIDLDALGIESHRPPVREHPLPSRFVHQRTQLGKAPAQRAARVIRYFPKHRTQSIAPMAPPVDGQIGQQGARPFGGWQRQALAVTDDLDLSE